ncbi:HPr family phosphocarrier protein [uncultured Desulfosarcina sp.]|uniref:HPr family phosphocarrier protein n=1 Tax=uncultured Desulfosarcina sp. TaxID=218289 RepID=UPI0029C6BC34|nr:HPr family phosphocarrier protein [uncultured Desulfosarcina sp.]
MNDPYCEISFSEKVRIFSFDYLKCCVYITNRHTPNHVFTKKLYSKLISTSQVLEDFLDFHGAKNSEDWYLYRELCATVRHLSLGAYCQKHILNRLIFYDIPDTEVFREQGEKTLTFLNDALRKLAPVIIDEASRLNIAMPVDAFGSEDFPGITTSEMLKYDIDDDAKDVQKRNIVKIASEFLSIAASFDPMGFYEPYGNDEIAALVPETVNEVQVRRFEMLVHNLQSSFDTYVIHGGFRFGDRKLKSLRSYFSIVFHLLQMMGRLLHFYERHLHEAGYKNTYKRVQDKLASLVDPVILLDRTVNYGLFYACHYLNSGKKLAREILNENIERSTITVGIPVKLGFHSRPSLLVAKIVQHFGGQVELVVGQDRFDASSVLDIQWAGGKIQKEKITEVTFEGDTRALAAIQILAGVNYGEDTMGKGVPLPSELSYLK